MKSKPVIEKRANRSDASRLSPLLPRSGSLPLSEGCQIALAAGERRPRGRSGEGSDPLSRRSCRTCTSRVLQRGIAQEAVRVAAHRVADSYRRPLSWARLTKSAGRLFSPCWLSGSSLVSHCQCLHTPPSHRMSQRRLAHFSLRPRALAVLRESQAQIRPRLRLAKRPPARRHQCVRRLPSRATP